MSDLIIINAAHSDRPCGVADHSLKLDQHLSQLGMKVQRISLPLGEPSQRAWPAIQSQLERIFVPHLQAGKLPVVLVQFTPRTYETHGVPLRFARIVSFLKKRGCRIILFAHELWGVTPLLNKRRPFELVAQWLFQRAARQADIIISNTSDHCARIQKLSTGREIRFCPIFSNLPEQRRHGSGENGTAVVFGLGGTRVRVLSDFSEKLREWQAAGKITKIILAGQTSRDIQAKEDALLPANLGRVRVSGADALVYEALCRGEVALVHQDQKSFSKSGSLMAFLAAGIPVVAPRAIQLEPGVMIHAADEWWQLSQNVREANATALANWYYQNAALAVTIHRLKGEIEKRL